VLRKILGNAIRSNPRLWAKWCNLCSIYRGWDKGFKACIRESVAALPEADRPVVLAWLDEDQWWSSQSGAALRGSTVV
jgi:hypothetical protein